MFSVERTGGIPPRLLPIIEPGMWLFMIGFTPTFTKKFI